METNNILNEETIDKAPIIDINLGYTFNNALKAAAILVAISMIYTIIKGSIIAIIILFVCLIIITTKHGVQIDFSSKRLKKYSKYLFSFKGGSWQDISAYPFITVLKFNRGNKIYSRSNREIITNKKYYEVYLLNKSHRKRILISRFSSEEDAKNYAISLNNSSYLEYVKYNPITKQ